MSDLGGERAPRWANAQRNDRKALVRPMVGTGSTALAVNPPCPGVRQQVYRISRDMAGVMEE